MLHSVASSRKLNRRAVLFLSRGIGRRSRSAGRDAPRSAHGCCARAGAGEKPDDAERPAERPDKHGCKAARYHAGGDGDERKFQDNAQAQAL